MIRAFLAQDKVMTDQMEMVQRGHNRTCIITATHYLQTGWISNVNELMGNLFLNQNLQNPLVVKEKT